MREEGGTPAIVESIRAGLVVKLKMSVGVEFIMQREESLRKMFMSKFQINDRMLILGHNNPTQLPINCISSSDDHHGKLSLITPGLTTSHSLCSL